MGQSRILNSGKVWKVLRDWKISERFVTLLKCSVYLLLLLLCVSFLPDMSLSLPLPFCLIVSRFPLNTSEGQLFILSPSDLNQMLFGLFLFVVVKPQLARPETCCLRCWSSIPPSGYQWTRPYSTPTSMCGTIQLRWRRWVGLLAELCIDFYPRRCLRCICMGVQKITNPHNEFLP